jgi:iron(III) transport system substrate-binding protein
MRKFFGLTVLMFFLCSLFLTDLARGDSAVIEAANKEGKVTVYTARSIEILHGFAKEFNKIYPKIKVEVYRAGTYQVVQKFMSESQTGKKVCDVYWGWAA